MSPQEEMKPSNIVYERRPRSWSFKPRKMHVTIRAKRGSAPSCWNTTCGWWSSNWGDR
jgi:hypothetical protein